MTKDDHALYKGDDFIMIGTIEELADYLNVKTRTIKFYKSPVYRRRTKRGYVVIEIDEEDTDEEEKIETNTKVNI